MYKLKKGNIRKMTMVNPRNGENFEMDASSEGLLESIEELVDDKVTSKGTCSKIIKGTVHFGCWLMEGSIRHNRTLRGEENPVARRIKLFTKNK